jgi:anti-sigma factor RsiW
MSEHYPDDVLSSYLDGDLTPVEAGRIAEHVAVCPGCRRVLTQVREIRDAAGALDQLVPAERTWQAIQQQLSRSRRARWPTTLVTRWVWVGVPTLAAAALLVAFLWGRHLVAARNVAAVVARTPSEVCQDSVVLVYRDYVAGMDEAIRECEAAMAENPGNVRVRRAWLGAQTDRASAVDRLVSGGD